MKPLFEKYLQLSENKRKGYVGSLGKPAPDALQKLKETIGNDAPTLLQLIYTTVAGTDPEAVEESFIDFIPGFFIIHIDHWADEYKRVAEELGSEYLPFLASDEDAYYAINAATGEIVITFLDEFKLTDVIFADTTHFLQTIIANYDEKVYYVDRDGWLDFDDDEEVRVARRLNPNISYWEDGWG